MNEARPRVFVSPEVVEVHIANRQPLSPDKAKLVWLMERTAQALEPVAEVIPIRKNYPDIVA